MKAAHLDYDTLAELAEGLLPEPQAATADAHLAGCAECRDRSAQIADVTRLLADAPVPPMPAELASRIDQALAAEATATSNGAVISLDSRRGRRRMRILSAAAASVIVLGGGTVVGHALLSGSMSSENGAAQTQAVQDRTGSVPARPSSPGQPGSALKAPGGLSARSNASGGYVMMRSGTDYTAGQLSRQVSGQLARAGAAAAEARPGEPLSGCVQGVTRGRTPMLVDVASYEGRPATVIVLPGSADRLDVWVVGPACSASNSALIKHAQTAR